MSDDKPSRRDIDPPVLKPPRIWPTYLPGKIESRGWIMIGGEEMQVTYTTEAGDEKGDPPVVIPSLVKFDTQDKRWFMICDVFNEDFQKAIVAAIYRDVYGLETE